MKKIITLAIVLAGFAALVGFGVSNAKAHDAYQAEWGLEGTPYEAQVDPIGMLAGEVTVQNSLHPKAAFEGMSDNFNNNKIDNGLWSIHADGIVEETGGRLVFTQPISVVEVHSDAFTLCEAEGDFDARVDFELTDWPFGNGLKVGLLAHDPDINAAMNVERISDANPNVSNDVYLTNIFNTGEVVPTSDLSGTLRLTRNDATITGYYFDGSEFVEISSALGSGDSVNFSLALFTQGGTAGGQAAFDNFTVTAESIECDGSDGHGWNDLIAHEVGFEADTSAGFFELHFERIVGAGDEAESELEVCFPHYDGFICEDVEVDEEDMEIDFGFPLRESTASIRAYVDGCGLVDIEIVLTLGQEYERFRSMIFDPDGKLITIVKGVEINAESIIGEDVTGVVCGVALSPDNVFEASHNMTLEEVKERGD